MLPDSLPVHEELPERHVHLDAATVANLELVTSQSARGSGGTLYGLLNHTTTKGGGACMSLCVRAHAETCKCLCSSACTADLRAASLQRNC
jgi:DNA mismatch repair ATPase MutS